MAPTATTSARTTRSKTGNSKPRIFPEVEATVPTTKKRAGTKKKSTTKANTSKPRVKKTTTGRVTKPKATKKTATKKDKTTKSKIEGKINGAVEKVEGALEGKSGKKVGKSRASTPSTDASAGPLRSRGTMKLPHRPAVPARKHHARSRSRGTSRPRSASRGRRATASTSRARSTSRVAATPTTLVAPTGARGRAPARVTRSGVAGARTPSMERAEELSIGPVRASKTRANRQLCKSLVYGP